MYVIRFTIRRKSIQSHVARYAYLQLRNGKAMVGNYSDGGSNPISIGDATRFASQYDATLALIEYLKQIGTWNSSMWVKNPKIVEVND